MDNSLFVEAASCNHLASKPVIQLVWPEYLATDPVYGHYSQDEKVWEMLILGDKQCKVFRTTKEVTTPQGDMVKIACSAISGASIPWAHPKAKGVTWATTKSPCVQHYKDYMLLWLPAADNSSACTLTTFHIYREYLLLWEACTLGYNLSILHFPSLSNTA